jgi:gamma-glutamyltranspeptidase/glutathione hydrolase
VSAPRFAAVSDTIEVSNRILHATERALQAEGYVTLRHPQSYQFARVHAIRCVDGLLDGGADPAAGGMAMAV